MDRHHWTVPVSIATELPGSYRSIENTREAARLLLDNWPERRGSRYLMAMQICIDALEGRADDRDAREAFVDAAEEAKLFVRH